MDGLFLFIIQNPSSCLTVGALLVSCLFAGILYKAHVKRLEVNETKMDAMSTSLNTHFQKTSDLLSTHYTELQKAVKSFDSGVITMKEKVFGLKEQITEQIHALREMVHDTKTNLELANQTAEIAIKNLNDKLGRVILIEKDIEVHKKYIEDVQTRVGQHSTNFLRDDKRWSGVAEALKAHRDRLQKIELELKKKG